MNTQYINLIDTNGLTVAIAKRHIVAVRVKPNIRYGKSDAAVEVSCVNGHCHDQIYTSQEAACNAWEEIMVELEDFT